MLHIEMDIHGYAYFVERPRRLEDLLRPHLVERERPYSIVTVVQLPKIDYENFVADMLADRKFIDDYGKRCKAGMYGTACWCSSVAAQAACLCCRNRAVLSRGQRKHYLSDHLTQEIRTEDISEAVGLSPYHLSRLFKTHTGLTMREYLIRERIEAAKQLLAASDRTIPQIASLLRFCDQSYFTMVFRRQTGLMPGEYRKENRR